MELLAPAGNFEKLKTAFYFGADAVYIAGKKFGLRAFAGNFDEEGLKQAVDYAKERGKKTEVNPGLAHQTVSDAQGRMTSNLPPSGFWGATPL